MTTDTAQYDFERSFPVSPDRLWHLLTDAGMRERWSAPGPDMVLTMETTDFRRGGLEKHRCGPADAPEFEVETRWYRIEAPTDAAFTETIIIGGDDIATSLVTYRVSSTSTGSKLHATVAISSFCGPEASEEFQAGWDAGLNNLEALAAAQEA